jgi:hypothetical protein
VARLAVGFELLNAARDFFYLKVQGAECLAVASDLLIGGAQPIRGMQ